MSASELALAEPSSPSGVVPHGTAQSSRQELNA